MMNPAGKNKAPTFEEILASLRRPMAEPQAAAATIGHRQVKETLPAFEDDDDFELPSMFRPQVDGKANGEARAVSRSMPTLYDRGEGTPPAPDRWLEMLQEVTPPLEATHGGAAGKSEAPTHALGDPQRARGEWPTVLAGPNLGEIPRQMVSFKDTLISRMGQPQRRYERAAAVATTLDLSSPEPSVDEGAQGDFNLRA